VKKNPVNLIKYCSKYDVMIPKVFSISHYLRKRAKRICAEKGHAVLYRNHIRPEPDDVSGTLRSKKSIKLYTWTT